MCMNIGAKESQFTIKHDFYGLLISLQFPVTLVICIHEGSYGRAYEVASYRLCRSTIPAHSKDVRRVDSRTMR